MTVEINREVFYTTAEFAALMRYANERPITRLIKKGKIPNYKRLDGRYLIPAWYVERQLEKAGGRHGTY